MDVKFQGFGTNLLNWLKISKKIRILSGFSSCSAYHEAIKAQRTYVILSLQRSVQNTLVSAAYIQTSPCRGVFVLRILAVMKTGGHLLTPY